jgi:hypothetical protein
MLQRLCAESRLDAVLIALVIQIFLRQTFGSKSKRIAFIPVQIKRENQVEFRCGLRHP